jgi:hypothetical protein
VTFTRKLGLAVLAALALSVFANAASASAANVFLASEYSAYLKADAGTSAEKNYFVAFGQTLSCRPSSFESSKQTGPSPTFESEGNETSGHCYSILSNGPINTSNCKFALDAGAPGLAGKLSIGAAGCGPIVFENAWGNCEWVVEPGANYKGSVSLKNKSGKVEAVGSITGLKVTMTGCGEAGKTDTAGTWGPEWNLKAENPFGEPVNLEVILRAPVASYEFDEGEGSTAHDSAGEHDGTINGGAFWGAGMHGGGLEFDGTNDEVVIADSNDFDLGASLTLEAWVEPATNTHGSLIQKAQSGEGKLWGYWLSAGYAGSEEKPGGAVSDGKTLLEAIAPNKLPIWQWTHLALTSDGKTQRVYINGKQVATESAVEVPPTAGPLRIGKGVPGFYTGVIDELRIYDEVLPEGEIQTEMEY